MSIHYKFKSSLDYDTVTFDGLHMTVGELKRCIIQQKKIGRSADFELQITNAQTKEVYSDDEALVPKNSSVVVSRIPTGNSGKKWDRSDSPLMHSMANDNHEPLGYDKVAKSADLTTSNAPEDEKIRAMMSQSTQDYDPSKYVKQRSMTGPIPPTYLCFRCGRPGHWIKNCPTNAIEVKRSTGIPRSFMVAVDGPDVPGALLTSSGQFAVPVIDHEAYKEGKKERPPFAKEPTPEKEVMPQIPEELQCMICRDLLVDAVLIPCCGNSYCDECVRQTLLDSEEHECPTCHEKDISPDTLIPNRFLRTAVLSFKNETGYTKARKPVAAVPEPEALVPERTASPLVPPPAKSTPPPAPMLPITCHQPIVLSIKTQLTELPAASTVSDPPLQLQASPLPEDDRPDTPVTDERPHDNNEQEEPRGTSPVKEEKSPGVAAVASPPHHDSDNSQSETGFTIATITTRGPGCVMPPLSPGYPSGKPPRPKTGPPSTQLQPQSSSHRHSGQRYDSPPPHHRDSRDSMYMKDPRSALHHSSYGPPPPYPHHPPQGQHHSTPLQPSHLHLPPQHYPPRSGSSVQYHSQQPPPPINHSGMHQGPPSSMPPVLAHQPPPPGLAPLPPRPVYCPPPQSHHLHPNSHGQGQNDPYHHPHHQMQQSHHSNLPHARPHPHSHIGPPHPHGPPMMAQHPPHLAQHPQQMFPPQQHMGPPVSMHKDPDYYAQHRAYHERSRGPYDPMDNFARELFDYHRREEHGGLLPPPGVVTQGQSPSGHHGPMQGPGRSRRPRSTSRSPYSSRSSYRSRSRSRTHSRSRSTSRSRSRSRRRPASRSRSFSYSSHSRSRSRSRTPRSRSRSFSGSSRSRSHSSGRYAKSRSRSPRARARHYSPTGYRRSRSSRHHHHHHRREFGSRGQGNVPQQTGMLPLPVLTNVFPTPPERNQRPYQDFRYSATPNAPPPPNANYRYPGEMGYDGRYDQRYPPYPNRADNFYNPNDNRGHHRSWSPNTTPLNPAGMPPTMNTTGGRDDQRGRPRSGDVRRGGPRGSSRSPVPRQNSMSPTPAQSGSSGRGAPVADARESSKNKDGHHYRRSGKERRREEPPQEMRENTTAQKRDDGKSHAKKSERTKEEPTEASTRASGEKSKGHVPTVTSSDKGVTRTKDKEKKHKHRSSKTVDPQGNVTKVSKKKGTKKSSSSADEISNGDNNVKDSTVTADSKQSKGSGDRKKKRKKEREVEQDIVNLKQEPVPIEEPDKEIFDKVPDEDTVLETIPEVQDTPTDIPNDQLVDEAPVEPAKVLPEGFQRTFVEVAPEELKVQSVPAFVIPTLYDDLPPETLTVNQAFVSEEGREEDMEPEEEEEGPDDLNDNVLTAPVPELSKWELEENEGGANSPNQAMEAGASSGNPTMGTTTRVVVLDSVRGPGGGSGSTLPPDIVQRAEKVIFHKALSAALGPSLMPRPSSGMKMAGDEESKRGSGTNTRDGRDREKHRDKDREKDKDRQREKEKLERTSRGDKDKEKEKDEKDVKDGKIKLDRSKFHGKMEVTIGSSNRKVSLKQEESAMGTEEMGDVKGVEKERDWRGEEKKHERRTDAKTDASKHRRDIEQAPPVPSEKSSRDPGSSSSSSRKPIPSNRRSRSRSRSKTRTLPSSRRSDQDDKDRQRDKPKPSDPDRVPSDRKDVRSRSARSRSRDRSRETDRSRKQDDKPESRDSRKDSPKRVRMVSQERGDPKRSSKMEDEKQRDRTVDENRGKDGKEGKDGVRDRRKSVLDESKFEPDYDDVNEGVEGGGTTAKGTKRTWSTSPERNVKMVRRDSEKSVNRSQSGSGSVSGTESTSSQSNSSSDEAAAQKKKSKAAAAAKTKPKKNKHKKHKKHKHKHKKKKSHKKKDESVAESAKPKN